MDTESTNKNLQPANPEVDPRALKPYEKIGLRVFTAGVLALPAVPLTAFVGRHIPILADSILSDIISLEFTFSVVTMPLTFLAALINIFILIYDHAPFRSSRVAATVGVLIGSVIVEAMSYLLITWAILAAMSNAMNPH